MPSSVLSIALTLPCTPHASVVASTHTLMTCTLNPDEVYKNLTEEHLVWFSSSDTPGE